MLVQRARATSTLPSTSCKDDAYGIHGLMLLMDCMMAMTVQRGGRMAYYVALLYYISVLHICPLASRRAKCYCYVMRSPTLVRQCIDMNAWVR
jgi:hypothetical protein